MTDYSALTLLLVKHINAHAGLYAEGTPVLRKRGRRGTCQESRVRLLKTTKVGVIKLYLITERHHPKTDIPVKAINCIQFFYLGFHTGWVITKSTIRPYFLTSTLKPWNNFVEWRLSISPGIPLVRAVASIRQTETLPRPFCFVSVVCVMVGEEETSKHLEKEFYCASAICFFLALALWVMLKCCCASFHCSSACW